MISTRAVRPMLATILSQKTPPVSAFATLAAGIDSRHYRSLASTS